MTTRGRDSPLDTLEAPRACRGAGLAIRDSDGSDMKNAIVRAMSSRPEPVLGGPASVVETACPLDCPDACSLAVTVQHGKLVKIDGGRANPVTDGYICAKVRKFGDRVYGPDRLLYPAVRIGRKGDGQFKRVTWGEALEQIAARFQTAKATHGAASILPFSYGGSNGLLTQAKLDAQVW